MAGNPKAGRSPGELTRHEGDLEPDEPYDRLLFADAAFEAAVAGNCHFMGNWERSTVSPPVV